MKSRHRGSVSAEATIVAFVSLAFVVGSSHLFIAAYRWVALHYIVQRAARWGTLGHTVADPSNPAIIYSRENSVALYLRELAKPLGVDLDAASISVCRVAPSVTGPTNCPVDSMGSHGDLFMVSVVAPMPLFSPLVPVGYVLHAGAVARNE